MRTTLCIVMAFVAVGFTGCLGDGASEHDRFQHPLPHGVKLTWAPGALASIDNPTDRAVALEVPFGWLPIAGDGEHAGTFEPWTGEGGGHLEAGTTAWFLAPPRDSSLKFTVDGTSVTIAALHGNAVQREGQVLSGARVWDLSAYQEEHFPHRQVNLPGGNYWTAIAYFVDYFEGLGLEVEVDPFGTKSLTMDGTVCTPDPGLPPDTREPCPGSVANVVATLPGTDPNLPTIFVAGGHFDMVAGTTHAAFDNTAGTVATMELARAMSKFEWRHTLKFGLWGGEEDGILGSRFWVASHPDAATSITSYWNLDVTGMAWPAPLTGPDPLVVAAGPDIPSGPGGQATGPVVDSLLSIARELQTDWFGYPSEVAGEPMWHYEGIISGQGIASGTTGQVGRGVIGGYAGVNAVSDHTSFWSSGIPAFFIFNGDALAPDNPVLLHTERDTLENMTRYSFFGGEATAEIMATEIALGQLYEWDDAERDAAKAALADSWETIMWFPFYTTVLQDIGYWNPPSLAGFIAEGPAGEFGL